MRQRNKLKYDILKNRVTSLRINPELREEVERRLGKTPQNIVDDYYNSVIDFLRETPEEVEEDTSWQDL